jgi:hypothetical protein
MRTRDKNGRFKAKAEAEVRVGGNNGINYYEVDGYDGYDGNARGGRGIFIPIPFYEYFPFFCILLVLGICFFPYYYVLKPLVNKMVVSWIMNFLEGLISSGSSGGNGGKSGKSDDGGL